jgi:hypothetical protein
VRPWSILLIAAIPLAISFVAGLGFWGWYVVDVDRVPIEVAVINDSLIGFNAGTDKLYFGSIAPAGGGERKTHIVNAVDAKVSIAVEGPLAEWITVSENNFYLPAGVKKDIMFRMTAPSDAIIGNYTSDAVIRIYRAMPWEKE